MGKYSLEGSFLGFEDLTYQLQLWGADYDYSSDYRNFGKTVYTSCKFDASVLINSYLQPNNTDVFYDLYLKDYNGDYIDVPVKINNYVDSTGSKPNQSSNSKNWKLTRRFFIYDTMSSLEGTDAYKNGGYGTYIRWLSKVNIVVELKNDHTDTIYVPYVELEYSSKAKVYIPSSSTSTVSFKTSYKMDPSNFWLIALILFGILNGLVVFITVIKLYLWITHHPRQLMGSVYPLKLIYRIVFLFLESWSTLMFWYLFSLTCAWYFFFKLDSAPYILLPLNEDNNYLAFDVIFGFVLGIKLILIHAKLMHQSFCSYYVLDREKNMNSIYSTLTNVLNQHKSDDRGFYDREVKEMDEPKAWRPLFVMNELNELSTTTVISVEVILIWTSFLLVGENWKTAAHYDPIVLTPVERTLHSYAIMFFLFSVIILTIGMTIYIIRYSVSFLFSLPYMDFVDLWAVANVSLFIFDEKFHGYYIHGESPTKSSDVSLGTLKKALDNEGDGNAASRGLVQKYPGLQTFEFYCPYSERKIFDDVFEENKASLKQKRGDEDAFKKKNQRADFIYKTKDLGMFEEDFRKVIK